MMSPTKRTHMNGAELKAALEKLELTQMGLSRLLNVAARRVRYWVADERPVPTEIAMLLNLMLDSGTAVTQLRTR